ncbi:MAG: molybdopterin-dependent oxidoreductase [Nitrospinaceae bacterium]|nr:molybdopterin-dependent oxidoreductase [Nitrospinaceae bacterium]NIX33889.1 molybdopterin-dependent oxidoreductase [Nitrospinaceae bacterium]NIY14623.1 molybdopterin-dependent oxidoreductase [Nitrospinaceae bacterium]
MPFITPNRKFYVEDIHGPPRSLDLKTWRLKITGKVDQPLTLSLDQIRKRPAIRQIITLSCIGNPVGGFALGNAEWEGISLRSLLDEADPDFFASTLIFKGADGYHDSVPLRRGRHRGALLVHTMNGEPLPLDHGYPLRVLIPGLYGIKQVKWITEIEVSNKSHTGYWQKQNWASDGKVKVISRIDFPRHGQRLRTARTTLRGIAFAGDRGIQYVQVSIDGERTWSLARLEKPPSSYSWVFWSLPVRFPKSGRYSIAVRAADQYSGVQFDGHRDPFPSGTSGIHRIQCRVHMVGR